MSSSVASGSRQASKERQNSFSRQRISMGQQILNMEGGNRLKNMKANFQIDQSPVMLPSQMQGDFNINKKELNQTYTMKNSPRGNSKGDMDFESVVFENQKMNMKVGSTPYRQERTSSKHSVNTRAIEDAILMEEAFGPRVELNPSYGNNKRSASNHQSYLQLLQSKAAQGDSPNASFSKDMRSTLYETSPVARHYSSHLDQTQYSSAFSHNRKLKMRDTFTKIFPGYTHGTGTVYAQAGSSLAHQTYVYPSKMTEGKNTAEIDRTYTKKMDFIKTYTEEILKIANMRRNTK